jgi:hypothetical protein
MREHRHHKVGGGHADSASELSSAVGKTTRAAHEAHAAHTSAFEGAEWEDIHGEGGATATAASKKKKKHKDGLVETLAKIGEEVLGKIADKILGDLKKLTEYSPHEATEAKRLLEHLAATCGPSSVSLQRRVEAAAHKIGGYQFAKLLRKGLELARDMTSACHDLRKNFDDDGLGAIFKFIGSALGGAKDWATAINDHAKAVHEVDTLLVRIGSRCGKQPEIDIPKPVKPLIREAPHVDLELDKALQQKYGITRQLQLPGIKLPGHKSVIPKPVLEIHGPVVTLGL